MKIRESLADDNGIIGLRFFCIVCFISLRYVDNVRRVFNSCGDYAYPLPN